MSEKRKLHSYSFSTKQKIISDYDGGMRNKDISEKYDINHSTISNIIRNRNKICSVDETLSKKKRLRTLVKIKQKRKLQSYSFSTKQKIINDYDSKIRNKDLCEKYSISHSTISNIIRNRDIICSVDEELAKKKRLRTLNYPELEEHLVHYLTECRNSNIPISGKLIQQAAKDYNTQLKEIPNFKASEKWIFNFMKRNKISMRKTVGDGDKSMPDNFIALDLPMVTKEEPTDEASLFLENQPVSNIRSALDTIHNELQRIPDVPAHINDSFHTLRNFLLNTKIKQPIDPL